jgi:hypothetical protein
MPEQNGSGRLERIEIILEKLASHSLSFAREANERMTRIEISLGSIAGTMDRLFELREADRAEMLEQRKEMLDREKRIDERIEKLTLAIGELITRIPPQTAPSRATQ